MNKNAIWAVVLSALVLFGYMFVQAKFFAPKNEEVTAVEQTADTVKADEAGTVAAVDGEVKEPSELEGAVASEKEETFTVKTNKLEVVFTNRGGDVTSLKVLEHKDTWTKEPVELATNVTPDNKLFALAIGGAESKIIDDIFMVKEIPSENGEHVIAFAKKYAGYMLVKKYTFKDDEYVGKLEVMIEPGEGFKGISFASGDAKASYTLRTAPQIGPYYNKKLDRYENRTFIAHKDSKANKTILTDGKKGEYKKPYNWAGITGKYFAEIVIPADPEVIAQTKYEATKTDKDLGNAQAYFVRKEIGSERVNDTYYFYAGPRSEKEFKKYNVKETNAWNLEGLRLIDGISTYQFLGWLETILKWIMEYIYKFIPNWGISIIIMTILFKIVLFPINYKQMAGTQKMQEIQPRMKAIQDKYKDNPQRMQEETAKLYKEAGYNPMSGCLPMILQMMALFAMFDLFNNYFEFRGASFINGWIDDLSMGDSVLSWKYDIPFIGYNLRILPIIYLFSQLLYGKFTNMGGATNGQTAGTMKFMTYGLPIIFSFMFYNAPAGLLLFWTISNIFQFGQQMLIKKLTGKKADEKKNVVKFPKNGKKK